MRDLRRLIGTAFLAAIVAGLILSAARQVWIVPLILEAEEFEAHAPAPPDLAHPPSTPALPRIQGEHEAEWQPAEGWPRNAWTWAANLLTAFGFALLLTAGYALSGRPVGAALGLLWGLAGFVAVSGAPALGLPPELPGMPEADLAARQVWWVATVAATGGGLALLAFGRGPWLRLAGLPLLALPHVIGAPRADEVPGADLAALNWRFAALTLAINLGFWLILGLASGWAWRRGAR